MGESGISLTDSAVAVLVTLIIIVCRMLELQVK